MATRAPLHASILFLLSCGNAGDEQQWHDASKYPLENRSGVYYHANVPFSGRLFELAGADTLATSSYRQGLEHGEWRRFYPGTVLAERRFFDSGKKTGTLTGYWENGKPRIEIHFEANEYEGSTREWNRAGALIAQRHYHKGYEEGSQTLWYDNGKVRSNYVIAGGRRYGLLGTKNCVNVSDSIFRN